MTSSERERNPLGEPLETVTLTLCQQCLTGAGGECHTPGCALWANRAPDVPLRDRIITPAPVSSEPAGGGARAALEACEQALLTGIDWASGPSEGEFAARTRMHTARGMALQALAAASPAPAGDVDWRCNECGALESRGGCAHDFELHYEEATPEREIEDAHDALTRLGAPMVVGDHEHGEEVGLTLAQRVQWLAGRAPAPADGDGLAATIAGSLDQAADELEQLAGMSSPETRLPPRPMTEVETMDAEPVMVERMRGVSRCYDGGWHACGAGPCFDTVEEAIAERDRKCERYPALRAIFAVPVAKDRA